MANSDVYSHLKAVFRVAAASGVALLFASCATFFLSWCHPAWKPEQLLQFAWCVAWITGAAFLAVFVLGAVLKLMLRSATPKPPIVPPPYNVRRARFWQRVVVLTFAFGLLFFLPEGQVHSSNNAWELKRFTSHSWEVLSEKAATAAMWQDVRGCSWLTMLFAFIVAGEGFYGLREVNH